jgi:stalled ribosome alternative rescue factor ArfA
MRPKWKVGTWRDRKDVIVQSTCLFRERVEKAWKEKLELQREELEQKFQRERELMGEQKLKEIEDVK